MRYFANAHMWLTVVALCALIGASFRTLRVTNALVDFVNQQYPELWDKLFLSDWVRQQPGATARRLGRFDGMLLFNQKSQYYPDDPEFRRMLSDARWMSFAWLIIFVATLLSIAELGT